MIVENWMQRQPLTVESSLLVSEAKRLMSENKLHALPVVDGGRLRGLLTRANLLRLGHSAMRTQSAEEMNFFVTRLRVRDVMVRNPHTANVGETVAECLRRGNKLGVAQFPVLDNGAVVGLISAREMFQLASHSAGALEWRNTLTIAPVKKGAGVLGRIADAVEATGAALLAIYPIQKKQPDGREADRVVVLRFNADHRETVVTALESAGFTISEAINPSEAATDFHGAYPQ